MVGGAIVGLVGLLASVVAGPPILPELPRRGMRTPKTEASPKAEASPKTEAQPQPDAAPVSNAASDEPPDTQPATGSQKPAPEASPRPKPQRAESGSHAVSPARPAAAVRPPLQRVDTPRTGAMQGGLGPLVAATSADFTAWADDDQRAAAPLQRAKAPDSASLRSPGDRPPVAAKKPGYGDQVVIRRARPQPDPVPRFRRGPNAPERSATVVVGYRNFTILDALGRRQAWHMGSVEFTPFRRYFRLNFLTEAGVEGGEAARGGDRADFMVLQKLGVGLQYPHWVTPFIEGQGGVGVMRIEVFERNELALTWSVGVDVGAQWAVTQWLSLHAAVGWIHPVIRAEAVTVEFNRVAFKVGVGF
ncbi:MAG: hypothetical protein JKY37_26185 [Nannocystaceae bacterium]|nr:hypothetical protein [Nannocystaceae bacterium]